MVWLVLGLVLFLGAHSVRIFADGWRTATVARIGAGAWKGVYSLVSAAGLVLIVVGFGAARAQPVLLWLPPLWLRHVAALLNLVALVLLVAAYVPNNLVRAKLGHPMILGVKVWAVAHLASNQMLADVVLFGAFLAWSVLAFRAARSRDRAAAAATRTGAPGPTIVAVALGVAVWGLITFWAHGVAIGVDPLGR